MLSKLFEMRAVFFFRAHAKAKMVLTPRSQKNKIPYTCVHILGIRLC